MDFIVLRWRTSFGIIIKVCFIYLIGEVMKHKNNFFKRLFISSVLLLIYTIISTYSNISLKFISKPMNITNLGNILIGTFDNEFKNKTTQTSTIIFDQIKYQNDENIIFSSTNSVINIKPGIVIKIEKKDSLYNVTIQTKDNLYYEYKGLEAINCSLYQYLYTEEVIGNAIFSDDFYQYRIKIYDENGVYEY